MSGSVDTSASREPLEPTKQARDAEIEFLQERLRRFEAERAMQNTYGAHLKWGLMGTLSLALLWLAGHYSLTLRQMAHEQQLAQLAIEAAKAPLQRPSVEPASGVAGPLTEAAALALLQQVLSSAAVPHASPSTPAASRPEGQRRVSLSVALGIVGNFAAQGLVVAKRAADLKSELLKQAIEGGKEITVDAIKQVIGKMLDDTRHEPPPSAGAATVPPAAPWVQVNQYCGASRLPHAPRPQRDCDDKKK